MTEEIKTPPEINYLDYVPEDIKSNSEMMKPLESVKDISSLIKGYVHAQKQIGKAITVPSAEAKPEDWDSFYTKIGRPESPDKYEVKRPSDSKLPYDEGMEKKFLATAHKAGLNKRQAQGVLDWWNQEQESQYQQRQQTQENAEAELKKEWGQNYDSKVALAQRGLKRYGDENFVKFLEETGFGNHPLVIKVFAKIGENGRETPAPGGDAAGAMSKQEAQAEINKLMGDKEFSKKYYGPREPGHQEAIDKINELHHIAAM